MEKGTAGRLIGIFRGVLYDALYLQGLREDSFDGSGGLPWKSIAASGSTW